MWMGFLARVRFLILLPFLCRIRVEGRKASRMVGSTKGLQFPPKAARAVSRGEVWEPTGPRDNQLLLLGGSGEVARAHRGFLLVGAESVSQEKGSWIRQLHKGFSE